MWKWFLRIDAFALFFCMAWYYWVIHPTSDYLTIFSATLLSLVLVFATFANWQGIALFIGNFVYDLMQQVRQQHQGVLIRPYSTEECSSCGKPFHLGAMYCTRCGGPKQQSFLLKRCPACREAMPIDARFCPACRYPMSCLCSQEKTSLSFPLKQTRPLFLEEKTKTSQPLVF